MRIKKRGPEKRVVITGAGSGLRRAIALEFARREWNMGVSDINDAHAAETVKMIILVSGDSCNEKYIRGIE